MSSVWIVSERTTIIRAGGILGVYSSPQYADAAAIAARVSHPYGRDIDVTEYALDSTERR